LRDFYGITGTPGTGKKTIAPRVAAALGVPCVSLNELALRYRLIRRPSRSADLDVDVLKTRIDSNLAEPCLLFGHLLPYVLDRGRVSKIAVLRCDPVELSRRLEARRYPKSKVRENAAAELIGLIAAESLKAFGRERVAEIDTTDVSPSKAVTRTLSWLRSGSSPPAPIDWVGDYASPERLRLLLG
jgi:adenylate kinase